MIDPIPFLPRDFDQPIGIDKALDQIGGGRETEAKLAAHGGRVDIGAGIQALQYPEAIACGATKIVAYPPPVIFTHRDNGTCGFGGLKADGGDLSAGS